MPNWLTGGPRSSWLVYLLAALALASLGFVGFTFYHLMDVAKDESSWISLSAEVQVKSQKLSMSAGEAALGNLQAFQELSETHSEMSTDMEMLNLGSMSRGLPPVSNALSVEMNALDETWQRMSMNATRIIEREQLVNSLAEANGEFMILIPQIQAATDRSVRQLIESGAPNQQVFAASRQLVLADRMLRRVEVVLKGGARAVKAADELAAELSLFDQMHNALTRGNQRMGITQVRSQAALNTLGQVRRLFNQARPHVQTILDSSSDLFDVRDAADWIFLDSHEMFDRAAALSEAVGALPNNRTWPSQKTATIGLTVMILMVSILVLILIGSQRRRADVASSHNRRTQKAIMKLLDELSSLADGDLTVQATVTDEMTGAIADAVNYAVEQLRELVTGINETASRVAESAEQTRENTSQLADKANEQAGQVARATEKIQNMAGAFSTMAERSKGSSDTALESVAIAHSGADKVRETISGMDTIREQIQETSKRIKRLGESTQEIGDIVSMINDIAEQTNVLALNAAIQAASSGSSGKGFAVVADEVQQLAESATNATRRITSLVHTIQADTAEAVASMETTTSEVVNGAALAHDAGKALMSIENVSKELSGLIENITAEATQQSQNAIRISELMEGIRQVSIKTSEGTSNTASSVEELAELVSHLQESVADFKLPESP
jgi:twitching motility protein PilJ